MVAGQQVDGLLDVRQIGVEGREVELTGISGCPRSADGRVVGSEGSGLKPFPHNPQPYHVESGGDHHRRVGCGEVEWLSRDVVQFIGWEFVHRVHPVENDGSAIAVP